MARPDPEQKQPVVRRRPQQQRASHKVELILEAAMQLLDQDGYAALTTNAVANRAGVSIGTVYQYFANKQMLLDAIAEREMAVLAERVLAIMEDKQATTPDERLPRIIHAVMDRYGRRKKVHKLVVEHSLRRGDQRVSLLIKDIIVGMATDGSAGVGSNRLATEFVASHAIAGVLRALVRSEGDAPPLEEVERAMTRMLRGLRSDSILPT